MATQRHTLSLPHDLDAQLDALALETGSTKLGTARMLIHEAVNSRADTAFDKIWRASQWARDAAVSDVLTCAHNAGLSKTMSFSDTIRLLLAYEGAGRPTDTSNFVKEYKEGKPLTQAPPVRDPFNTADRVIAGTDPSASNQTFSFDEAPITNAPPTTSAPVHTSGPQFVGDVPVFQLPAGLTPANQGFVFPTDAPEPAPADVVEVL